MTFRRICVSLTVLLLLSAVNPARSEDKVLVPGDAPLRQSLLDSYREYHEWLLDIQLTEPQRRQWEGVFIGEFQKKSPARRRAVVTSWQTDAPDRERLAKLIDTERDQQ